MGYDDQTAPLVGAVCVCAAGISGTSKNPGNKPFEKANGKATGTDPISFLLGNVLAFLFFMDTGFYDAYWTGVSTRKLTGDSGQFDFYQPTLKRLKVN